MKLGLKGKTALVTGGARGIGKGICECLAEEEVNIGVIDKLEDGAKTTAEMLRSEYNVDSIAFGADVSKKESVDKAFDFLIEKLGKIDILVNNVGVYPLSWVEEVSETHWDEVFSVNLKSALFCSQAALPSMKKQGQGRIINAASVVGYSVPAAGESAYSAAKAAIVNFTMVLASELGPLNITVNAYSPGVIETELTKELREELGEDLLRTMPFYRYGQPKEVGNLVVFLASDAAAHITGATIPIANGQIITQNQWDAYKFYNKT